MILHPGGRREELLLPDIHDVVSGSYPGWLVDDPTFDPSEAIDIEALPYALRAMAANLKAPRVYRDAV